MTSTAVRRAEPLRWLGGPSPFGLVLPDAAPTPTTMYAPRGVALDDDVLVVSDTGNHRLLVWRGGVPDTDHAPADAVVGQPDLTTEGPGQLFLPTGVLLHEGRLVVADAWHHRILVWDSVDDAVAATRPMVLGQPDADGVTEGCGPQRFYWPFGVAMVGDGLWVADTGNRRVLGWHDGIPEPGRPADVVLGQPDPWSRGENRDDAVAADSMRWPHAITSVANHVVVADAGNHRVLAWRGVPAGDRPADVVIGQRSFDTAVEFPYRPQGPRAFRFPYGVTSSDDGALIVADTSNNRIGVVDDAGWLFTHEPVGGSVDHVLGQPDADANGENRWDRVAHDSLCWPYGVACHGDLLAVADSGNNRVTVWSMAS